MSPVEKDTDTATGYVNKSTHANMVTTVYLMDGSNIAKDLTTRKNSATTKSAVQIVSFRTLQNSFPICIAKVIQSGIFQTF